MSATTAAVNPAVPPAPSAQPARPGTGSTTAADEHRFDRHLDAARQPHDDAKDKPGHEDGQGQPGAKAESTRETEQRPNTEASAKKSDDPDAVALAAAMLALLGQAAPAKPLALASTVPTHAAGKPTSAVQVATAPAALALLAGTVAAATAAPPALAMDARALAPMLAKPAEQKDAPLDPAQLANIAASPLPAIDAVATVAPAHALSISSPAGTPAFAQELGEHIAWLGTQEVKQARIRLHPEDLGTLDVKVSMNHDRVDVSFAVQHPAAVHALQQTLPQLDSLLAQHGLALGQADVGQRQQHEGSGRGGQAAGAIGEVEPETGLIDRLPVAGTGMLDTFA